MFNEKNIYFNSIHPKAREVLEALTQSKNWDSSEFNKIMVVLKLLGDGQSIPSINTPETLHLQLYRKFFEDLLEKTKQTNREHGRAILVDKEKQSVVMSGKISIGNINSTMIDAQPQPGREKIQSLIGTIHTHPSEGENVFSVHGFSHQDYKTFLLDNRQQFMVVVYGESIRLIVMKTSVTPNNMRKEVLEKQIDSIETELSNNNIIERIIQFNKIACIEFGLVFYMANKKSNDLFTKVKVTE